MEDQKAVVALSSIIFGLGSDSCSERATGFLPQDGVLYPLGAGNVGC